MSIIRGETAPTFHELERQARIVVQSLEEQIQSSDPYERLGVSQDATQKEITTAAHSLLKVVHPNYFNSLQKGTPEQQKLFQKFGEFTRLVDEAYKSIKPNAPRERSAENQTQERPNSPRVNFDMDFGNLSEEERMELRVLDQVQYMHAKSDNKQKDVSIDDAIFYLSGSSEQDLFARVENRVITGLQKVKQNILTSNSLVSRVRASEQFKIELDSWCRSKELCDFLSKIVKNFALQRNK